MAQELNQMFEIPSHSANYEFVANPYVPGSCSPNSVVSFSLTRGARPCPTTQSRMLICDINGNFRAVKAKAKAKDESDN